MPDARGQYVRMRTAVESGRPLPPDVRGWFLAALRRYERGERLDAALGLTVGPGEAWRHPGRQVRRACMEAELLRVADLTGPRDSRTAQRIALVLRGERFDLPARALDYLFRCRHIFGDEMPCSRSAVLRILQGDTRAQRDGCLNNPEYSNSA